jgi:hypothetical protein
VARSRPISPDGIEHVAGVTVGLLDGGKVVGRGVGLGLGRGAAEVGRAVAALGVVEGEALGEALGEADERLGETLEPDVVVAGGADPPDAHAPNVTATVTATVSHRRRPAFLGITPPPPRGPRFHCTATRSRRSADVLDQTARSRQPPV